MVFHTLDVQTSIELSADKLDTVSAGKEDGITGQPQVDVEKLLTFRQDMTENAVVAPEGAGAMGHDEGSERAIGHDLLMKLDREVCNAGHDNQFKWYCTVGDGGCGPRSERGSRSVSYRQCCQ